MSDEMDDIKETDGDMVDRIRALARMTATRFRTADIDGRAMDAFLDSVRDEYLMMDAE